MTATTTARPATPRAVTSRRDRAASATAIAWARRGGDWRAFGPWVLGYLQSLTAAPMSDRDIADTVRGITVAWQAIGDQAEADAAAVAEALVTEP